jgi:hypothetical protein
MLMRWRRDRLNVITAYSLLLTALAAAQPAAAEVYLWVDRWSDFAESPEGITFTTQSFKLYEDGRAEPWGPAQVRGPLSDGDILAARARMRHSGQWVMLKSSWQGLAPATAAKFTAGAAFRLSEDYGEMVVISAAPTAQDKEAADWEGFPSDVFLFDNFRRAGSQLSFDATPIELTADGRIVRGRTRRLQVPVVPTYTTLSKHGGKIIADNRWDPAWDAHFVIAERFDVGGRTAYVVQPRSAAAPEEKPQPAQSAKQKVRDALDRAKTDAHGERIVTEAENAAAAAAMADAGKAANSLQKDINRIEAQSAQRQAAQMAAMLQQASNITAQARMNAAAASGRVVEQGSGPWVVEYESRWYSDGGYEQWQTLRYRYETQQQAEQAKQAVLAQDAQRRAGGVSQLRNLRVYRDGPPAGDAEPALKDDDKPGARSAAARTEDGALTPEQRQEAIDFIDAKIREYESIFGSNDPRLQQLKAIRDDLARGGDGRPNGSRAATQRSEKKKEDDTGWYWLGGSYSVGNYERRNVGLNKSCVGFSVDFEVKVLPAGWARDGNVIYRDPPHGDEIANRQQSQKVFMQGGGSLAAPRPAWTYWRAYTEFMNDYERPRKGK